MKANLLNEYRPFDIDSINEGSTASAISELIRAFPNSIMIEAYRLQPSTPRHIHYTAVIPFFSGEEIVESPDKALVISQDAESPAQFATTKGIYELDLATGQVLQKCGTRLIRSSKKYEDSRISHEPEQGWRIDFESKLSRVGRDLHYVLTNKLIPAKSRGHFLEITPHTENGEIVRRRIFTGDEVGSERILDLLKTLHGAT